MQFSIPTYRSYNFVIWNNSFFSLRTLFFLHRRRRCCCFYFILCVASVVVVVFLFDSSRIVHFDSFSFVWLCGFVYVCVAVYFWRTTLSSRAKKKKQKKAGTKCEWNKKTFIFSYEKKNCYLMCSPQFGSIYVCVHVSCVPSWKLRIQRGMNLAIFLNFVIGIYHQHFFGTFRIHIILQPQAVQSILICWYKTAFISKMCLWRFQSKCSPKRNKWQRNRLSNLLRQHKFNKGRRRNSKSFWLN